MTIYIYIYIYIYILIEIGCLGTYIVEYREKLKNLKFQNPGGLCLLQPVKNALYTIL